VAELNFRAALVSALRLPADASDDDVLTRVIKVVADSGALGQVWWLADKAERKGYELDPSEVLAVVTPGQTLEASSG
jgi:ABC-type metal ion transport system substrate-binding protein